MKVTIISFIIAGICVFSMFVLLALSFFGLDYKIQLLLTLIFLVLGVSAAGFGVLWSYLRLYREMGKLYNARRELHKEVRNLADTMSELNKVRGELKGSVAKIGKALDS